MSRRVLSTVLTAALAVAFASSLTWAQDCRFKPQFPTFINVVAHNGSTPDPTGAFIVRVQDIEFRGIPNVPIEIDFSACSDFRLCTNQLDPGVTVTCSGGTLKVTKYTDSNGVAAFTILGCAHNTGASPGCGSNAVVVRGCGQVLGNATACCYDQDGGGVGPTDLSLLMGDLFSGSYFARSDYDGNGALTPSDLSLFLGHLFSGQSAVGCSATSPPGTACP